MTREIDESAIQLTFKQFAPENCPIIEGEENMDLLDSSIYKDDGLIENVSIECDGTESSVCNTCPINNKAKIKHFLLG